LTSFVASFVDSHPTDTFPTVTPGAINRGFGDGGGGDGAGCWGGVVGGGSVGSGSVVGGGSVVWAGTAPSGAFEEAMANPAANPSSAVAASRPTATASTLRFTIPV
jgi:hypothetical protein